jgi:hypothetical protein
VGVDEGMDGMWTDGGGVAVLKVWRRQRRAEASTGRLCARFGMRVNLLARGKKGIRYVESRQAAVKIVEMLRARVRGVARAVTHSYRRA